MARKWASGRRFAQAAYSIAKDQGQLDRWLQDLRALDRIVGTPEVLRVLENPRVRFDDKAKLLETALPGASPLVLNLAKLLVLKGRLAVMPDLVEEFETLYDAQRGVARAEVVTAVPLSDADKDRVAQQLSKVIGKTVKLNARVDPSILGGMVARIGDELIDGSAATRLQQLRQTLVG